MGLVENKTCIVTGAAGSIGLATAKLLAGEGAKVMLVDFNAARLAEVAREFDPARTGSCVADVTDPAQVRDFILQTVEAFGPIDVLFSNAGNDGPLSPIADYPEDMFDKIIKTHVYGGFYTCKYAVPHMRDGGSIVIMSSIVGLKGVPGNCSYVMAKHALTGLMRGLSKELGHRGIRVNTVNPGPVDNEFMRTAEKTMSVVLGRDAGAFFDEQIPLGRHAKPEEVAEAVCFLASDRSRYTNGSAIMVDGGFSS
ncbi:MULTISPECIES: SDR family NAD(P)-dependent oxidoreductase [Rhizobium]|uniref:NAD(P)-dependent dehydrogenase (Short-subunit alcohol dehydrogenase family) n=1 Tax=Rhizobium tropici TaxID=398 RepID=A0A6P1C4W3_RHITR|nr:MULTISPECIES: SDR family oxidoreductase [Rhizobium]AGB74405.1 short-chain dehydrogenase/reductase [Rhizobium tropici CIAT 899]MBB4240887.1 NAD(P)-dependent dehydrogenase (short-subunit alcohol dehydrogenase family) [Rhizobium tropici]MBB5591697.1 NAD(P)-dependent dehydrogenase (short-subunit alcohol dehydrogenase family) [Rhizobium tropici]MBB6490750.1 NAD(P)-dependent dehydrogenase (short-subunit alcohol dehydrogenase family) [Rhizobium tropici]NEV12230.1 SDR family oxidoreductase [Rhizobi